MNGARHHHCNSLRVVGRQAASDVPNDIPGPPFISDDALYVIFYQATRTRGRRTRRNREQDELQPDKNIVAVRKGRIEGTAVATNKELRAISGAPMLANRKPAGTYTSYPTLTRAFQTVRPGRTEPTTPTHSTVDVDAQKKKKRAADYIVVRIGGRISTKTKKHTTTTEKLEKRFDLGRSSTSSGAVHVSLTTRPIIIPNPHSAPEKNRRNTCGYRIHP